MGLIKPNNYSEREYRLAAKSLAMGHPVRIGMVELMRKQECRLSDFENTFNLSRTAIRQHIVQFRKADLLDNDYYTHYQTYRIKEESMEEVEAFLKTKNERPVFWRRSILRKYN